MKAGVCRACRQRPYNIGVMNVGAPACGMNAAVRACVRLGLTQGYGVLGIRFGFEGLVQDNVSFTDAAWWKMRFDLLLPALTSRFLEICCVTVRGK